MTLDARTLVLALALCSAAALFWYYLREVERDAARERLRAGLADEDPEEVSLWRDAADLLQIARLQSVLATSPLARTLERRLRQLDIPYTLQRALLIAVIPIALGAGLIQIVFGRAELTLLGAVLLLLAAWLGLRTRARLRVAKVEAQLPGLINQMITTLRAGGVPTAALRAAAQNAPHPLGPSIARLVDAMSIGTPPGRAWRDWAALWDSRACDLLATAVRLKWEAGGEMGTLLEVILDQIESRRRRELRIRTLTAMARLSVWVLVSLPVVLFAYTWYVNPVLYREMIADPVGSRALMIMAGLMVVGFFWLRRIARIDH
jgi:tight adherence protein B